MTRSWKYIVLLLVLVGCTKTDEQEEVRPTAPKRELQFTAHLITESEWGAAVATKGDSTAISRSVGEPQMVCDTLALADSITLVGSVEPWFGELAENTADSTAMNYEGYEPPATRGTPIVNVKNLTQLRINMYNTGVDDFDVDNPPAAVTQAINATGSNGVFSYSPAYNWTNPDDKLTMFTYSPQAVPGTNGITETTPMKITYTVPADVTKQPDLCMASAVVSQANTDGNQHLRSLAMEHKLTAVGFAIIGYKVTISKVELLDVANTAILNLETGTWGAATGSVNFSTTVNKPVLNDNHNSNYTDITTTTGWLMMIPQNLSSSTTAKIKITFTEEGNTAIQTKEVLISKTGAAANWEAGKKVIYNIRMRTAPVVATTALTILDYRAGFTSSTSIKAATYGIASDDELTFTWGGTIFRMHRGAATTGGKPVGDGTGVKTGVGVINNNSWWFFTTDNNTTANDRSVDVTATGKKSVGQVFRVTQKKLDFSLAAPATLGAASGSTQSAKYTIISGLAPNQTHTITWSNVPSWIDEAALTKSFVTAGGNITYKAKTDNTTGGDLKATMTVKMGHLSKTVDVKQASATFTLTPATLTIGAPSASTADVVYALAGTSTTPAVDAATLGAWLEVSATNTSTKKITLRTKSNNNTGVDRAQEVTFKVGSLVQKVKVTQTAAKFTGLASAANIEANQGSEVTLSYTYDGSAATVPTVASSLPAWLEVAEINVSGSKKIKLRASATNPNYMFPGTRKVDVTFAIGDLRQTVTITQLAAYIRIEGAPTSIPFLGGTYTITVNSNVPWKLNRMPGITSISPESGNPGKTTVKMIIPKNTSSVTQQVILELQYLSSYIRGALTIDQSGLPDDVNPLELSGFPGIYVKKGESSGWMTANNGKTTCEAWGGTLATVDQLRAIYKNRDTYGYHNDWYVSSSESFVMPSGFKPTFFHMGHGGTQNDGSNRQAHTRCVKKLY